MKPVRALLVTVALAIAAPASAQPAFDDPDLMAWMQSANTAQKERLEALAAQDDAQSLLMAMSLVHPMFPLREDPESEIAAEQARAWALLERAAQLDPDDPVVAWALATCPAESGLSACGSPGSRERLQAVGGSRAEVQLWLAQVAQAVGDEAAVESHLQAAAEAPAFGAMEKEQSELFWRAWEKIEFPEADPAVVRSYAQHIEVDPEAFVEQMVAISVTARIVAIAQPALAFPLEACGVGDDAVNPGESRRRQCLGIFTTMADDRPSLFQRTVAEQGMVHLTAGTPEAGPWKQRLRSTLWVHETAAPLVASLSARHDPAYFAAWREGGEYQALLLLMEHRGLDPAPPDEWQPGNERMRELLERP